ncbi:DUF2849 domain-containing protein [Chelatococcus reniformis]|uniref:DUF2849 domain-containing protein n=1 Tax=Chelatococcus reniformis TaxID=1494448 RepID=A0A916U733_9HYPH|nr:DUF2849 domain-containing protein [Chelatococcus reniformis]GGC63024.1 hypothetical protein GCM10010994_22040 [Chelatococcus reniformis]
MKRAAKGLSLQVVTANALVTGSVVFLTASGTWSRDIAHAQVAEDAATAEASLVCANRDVERDVVVEPYLIDVRREGAAVRPVLMRERIRAQGGPTIRENRTLVHAST